MATRLKTKRNPEIDAEQLMEFVVTGMQEKKAVDVAVMDLRGIKNAVASFFVVCSGNSDTQTDAIKDSIEEQVFKACGELPWKKEGETNKEWILLDYVDVVAHVFRKDRRAFYGLEELWGDANLVQYDNPS